MWGQSNACAGIAVLKLKRPVWQRCTGTTASVSGAVKAGRSGQQSTVCCQAGFKAITVHANWSVGCVVEEDHTGCPFYRETVIKVSSDSKIWVFCFPLWCEHFFLSFTIQGKACVGAARLRKPSSVRHSGAADPQQHQTVQPPLQLARSQVISRKSFSLKVPELISSWDVIQNHKNWSTNLSFASTIEKLNLKRSADHLMR